MTKTIMLVDDDPEALILYGRLLRLADDDYEVVTAQDAADALNKRVETLPDLFIIDVMMPGVTGIELCRHLRAHDSTVDTPILMLSALGRPETIEEALQAGANDYVVKPSSLAELDEKIHSLLSLHATQAV